MTKPTVIEPNAEVLQLLQIILETNRFIAESLTKPLIIVSPASPSPVEGPPE